MTVYHYNLSRSQWEQLIDEWIFSERDRAILKRRLLDGICFEPLAEEFEMSVRQIKAIVYKSQPKIFAKCTTHISVQEGRCPSCTSNNP